MDKKTMQHLNKRWLYLAISAFAMLFAGIIYAWSILKQPFDASFGWEASHLSLNFTITICCFSLGNIVGSQLTKRIGIRIPLLASAALAFVGFFLVAGMSGESIYLLYLGYGIMGGLAIGMVFNIVISTTSTWFSDKKGLCSGCLMMCFGLSALVVGRGAEMLFNTPSVGWQTAYRVLGLCLGIAFILVAMILRPCPKEFVAAASTGKQNVVDRTTSQMMKTGLFWCSFLWLSLASSLGNALISFARDFSIYVGVEVAAASILVGLLSISNAVGRISIGILYDYLDCKKTIYVASAITVLASVITLIAALSHSVILCVIGFCVVGISYGSCAVIVANLGPAFFGKKHAQSNFSVLSLSLTAASVVASAVNYVFVSKGNFLAAFICLTIISCIAAALSAVIREPKQV